MLRIHTLGMTCGFIFLAVSSTCVADLELPSILDPKNRVTMGPEELKAWVAKWDAAASSGDPEFWTGMIRELVAYRDSPDADRYIVLSYNNKEIEDRIHKQYIAEYQRFLARYPGLGNNEMLQKSIERDGIHYDPDAQPRWKNVHQAEAKADALSLLATLAESTFSERIYDYVWGPYPGELRTIYLTYVLPEKTVQSILDASPGRRLGHKRHSASLYREGTGESISLQDAFLLLVRIAKRNLPVVEEKHQEIIAFIRRHAMHYYENREPRYAEVLDYGLRLRALELLEVISRGDEETIVSGLIENAPIRTPPSFRLLPGESYPGLEEKANSVLAIIRNRTDTVDE